MTTATIHPESVRSISFRRIAALAALEYRLLSRNKVASFNAVALTPMMVLATSGLMGNRLGEGAGFFTAMLVGSIAGFALLFVGYYNLTTTAVARREELMLKRLLTGSTSKTEILIAMAAPSMLIALLQVVLGLVVASLVFGWPPLINPVLVLIAVLMGCAVFSLLAYASTAFTKSVEAAQLTTLPIVIGAWMLSGLLIPVPDSLRFVFELSPLWPVIELVQVGLTGISSEAGQVDFLGSWLHAIYPLLTLTAWILGGTLLTRRYMVWEPRR